ncbi:ABC transporter substrate-binding protein [Nonomuraea guangzhouensis]|uniref:ABC transporter substrate-binding protein n=1 Tax=Nonomuraea guangzhouensis TaxID=1291555 RepID=A0ABW4GJ29_9ACTN|nr:extracellular solute-binding protein [Nonomuraea guangzhouensis]
MNSHRRWTAAMIAVSMASLLVTACGTSSNGSGGGSQTKLQIWDFSAEQVNFHKDIAKQFTKEHPNITIEWRSITQNDYMQTLPLAFQSNQAPDMFYWNATGLSQLLDQKWIRPLNPSGTVAADFTKRWPDGSFLEGINVQDGKTYGFPFSENLYWGPGYMFLNKQVFQEAGLDVNNPPKTWTDLKNTCAQIKAKTKAQCIGAPTKGVDMQRPWFGLMGSVSTDEFFDYKTGKFDLTEAPQVKTFAFLQELKKLGYLAPGTNDKNFSRQQFAAGQSGIFFDGTWVPSVWASQGFSSDKYVVAPRVDPDEGRTGAAGRKYDGNKYWVSSQTKHPNEMWTFIQWMTDPNGYFVKQYYKSAFGTLAYVDNQKMVTDPALKQIMQIAAQPGYRVQLPVPLLKCPDIAKSKAYVNALAKNPDGEWAAMGEALTSGQSLATTGAAIVQQRQAALEEGLKQEAASGLKVSMDCYTFSDWDYTKDYTSDKYPN